MAIDWNDFDSHERPGVAEALDAAGIPGSLDEPVPAVPLEFRPAVVVDAVLVGEALGLPAQEVPAMVDDRRIGVLCERGTDEHAGLFRFTFYFRQRRFRLVTDCHGTPTTAVETIVSSIGYQPFGPLNQITFGNGRVLSMSHDLDFAVESISDSATGGVALDYTYDAVGNVVGIDERLNTGATASRGISYDGLDRLTAMTDGATAVEGFSYDATGNRLSRTTTSTVNNAYATDSHRLTKVGTQNRVYDAAGNSVSIGSKHYTYDDYGRMR